MHTSCLDEHFTHSQLLINILGYRASFTPSASIPLLTSVGIRITTARIDAWSPDIFNCLNGIIANARHIEPHWLRFALCAPRHGIPLAACVATPTLPDEAWSVCATPLGRTSHPLVDAVCSWKFYSRPCLCHGALNVHRPCPLPRAAPRVVDR